MCVACWLCQGQRWIIKHPRAMHCQANRSPAVFLLRSRAQIFTSLNSLRVASTPLTPLVDVFVLTPASNSLRLPHRVHARTDSEVHLLREGSGEGPRDWSAVLYVSGETKSSSQQICTQRRKHHNILFHFINDGIASTVLVFDTLLSIALVLMTIITFLYVSMAGSASEGVGKRKRVSHPR